VEPDRAVIESLERIIVAGVAITTVALVEAAPGLELTFQRWRVLMVLGQTPDGATISDVAERVGVTVPATGRLLRRLELRGLVSMGVDERDRRAVRARLTPVGRSTREAIVSYRIHLLHGMLSRVDLPVALAGTLSRIADALDEATAGPPPSRVPSRRMVVAAVDRPSRA
jgi:DNA-binding MarR family transcriptional regulator